VSQPVNHTENYFAIIQWNADLTSESSAKMRAQDLRATFAFDGPTNCLLELFPNVKSSTDFTMLVFV